MNRQAAAILLVRHLKELLKSWVYKIDTRKIKLVSLSGISANMFAGTKLLPVKLITGMTGSSFDLLQYLLQNLPASM